MASTKSQIFVIQPFTKIAAAAYEIIVAAAAKAGTSVFRVDSLSPGVGITDAIQAAIRDAPLLIADITDANPNVMYEVGLAQAQQKPIIFIASTARKIPFDLAHFYTLIYDIASPGEAIDRLARAIYRLSVRLLRLRLKAPSVRPPSGRVFLLAIATKTESFLIASSST